MIPLWPVVWLVGILSLLAGCNSETPVPATTDVPSAGMRLTIIRVATHPFLARYNLRLRAEGPGGCSSSADLFPDTGGVSRRNLYQTTTGTIYVVGQFDARVVDGATCTIRLVEFRHLEEGATFLGAFDVDERKQWTFVPANVRAERPFEKR